MAAPVTVSKIISGFALDGGKSTELFWEQHWSFSDSPIQNVGEPDPPPWKGKAYLIDIQPVIPGNVADIRFVISNETRRIVNTQGTGDAILVAYQVMFTVTNQSGGPGSFDVNLITIG